MVIIGTSVIAMGALLWALVMWGKRKKLETVISTGSLDVIEPSASTTTSVLFPLKKGSGYKSAAENNAVKVVQRYLNSKMLYNWWFGQSTLDEDGMFGPLTETALYKLAGTKEVTYSFYKEMENYLTPVPYAVPNAVK